MSAALTFDDVLLVPQFTELSSRSKVSTAIRDKTGVLELDIPIITANMDTITEYAMACFIRDKGGIGALHRYMTIEKNIEQYKLSGPKVIVSVGCSLWERDRFIALRDEGAQYFLVDVAHAHASYVGEMIKFMRQNSKNICIIAGNVATRQGAAYLVESGADIIKVGIGPGSVCTTRIKTGFGVPQIKAITNCLDGAMGRSLIADGGIRTPGDVVKALAFGADFVMIGGMLAGTRPTPGEVLNVHSLTEAGRFKVYRGMASKEAHEDYLGELPEWRGAEGVSTKVPYREDEDQIINDLVNGLRSGLTYGGARDIRELQKNLRYEVITNAGRIEGTPHKVM